MVARNNRDDFPTKTKDILAKRVGYRCSNPSCQKPTIGPHSNPCKATNVGVAAHICAAAPGGPRYNPEMNSAERSSVENGIWLCQTCSTLVDKDERKYSIKTLHEWKKKAEEAAEINQSSQDIIAESDKSSALQVDDPDRIHIRGGFATFTFDGEKAIENLDAELDDYVRTLFSEPCEGKIKSAVINEKLHKLGGKQFFARFEERLNKVSKQDLVTDYQRPSLAIATGMHFYLPIMEGMKAMIFAINYDVPDYNSFSAYNSVEIVKTDENKKDQSICIYIDHPSSDGVPLLIFYIDAKNMKVIVNNGVLINNEVLITKQPDMFAYHQVSTEDENLRLNTSAYDTASIEPPKEENLCESTEYDEWVITDIRSTPMIIIDLETAQPVLRQIFYDETTHERKARIKLQPDKVYFVFHAMIGNSDEVSRPLTSLEIGKYYRQGVFGFPKDIFKAAKYLEEDGSAEALYQLALIFKLEPDFASQELYSDYLHQAIAANHEKAFVEMALNINPNELSNTVIQDRIISLESNLSPKATIGWFVLGNLWEEIDPGKAFECYYTAAINDYTPAVVRLKCPASFIDDSNKTMIREAFTPNDYGLRQYCYGCALYFGYGIEPRKKVGIQALEKSADNGDLYALTVLTDIFMDDDELRNQEKALYLLEQLAAKDSSYIVQLANWYTDGKGCAICKENDIKALTLLKKKAIEKNPTAINNLAWMYENGRGCEVDYHEARLLYKKAAELGNGTAYCHLGKIYEKGLGVSPNLNKAIEYYSVAAQKGNQAAKKKLEELSLS